jgi:hypothetical protein
MTLSRFCRHGDGLLPVSAVLRADKACRIAIFTTKAISEKALLLLSVTDTAYMQRPVALPALLHGSP